MQIMPAPAREGSQRARPPAAIDIRWGIAPAPWSSSARLLSVAVKMLPAVEDDIAADVIAQLALTLVDRDDELTSVRAVLTVALDLAHASQSETSQLRQRVVELRQALKEASA